jgi:hypothetical protein
MKKWIKNKLRKILEIESLELEIESLEKSFLYRITHQYAVDMKLQEEINNASKKIQSLEKTIKNTSW